MYIQYEEGGHRERGTEGVRWDKDGETGRDRRVREYGDGCTERMGEAEDGGGGRKNRERGRERWKEGGTEGERWDRERQRQEDREKEGSDVTGERGGGGQKQREGEREMEGGRD